MCNQRKKDTFLMAKTAQIECDERMCKFENVLLKNNLPKFNGKQVCSWKIDLGYVMSVALTDSFS